MRQLDERNHRDADLGFADFLSYGSQNFPSVFASALSGN